MNNNPTTNYPLQSFLSDIQGKSHLAVIHKYPKMIFAAVQIEKEDCIECWNLHPLRKGRITLTHTLPKSRQINKESLLETLNTLKVLYEGIEQTPFEEFSSGSDLHRKRIDLWESIFLGSVSKG